MSESLFPEPEPSEQEEKEYERLRAQRRARERLDREEEEAWAEQWTPVSGHTFDPNDPKPPGVLMRVQGRSEPLIPAGRRVMAFGTRSSLKTWLWLYVAFQELRAGRCVLVLDHEMGERAIVRRLHTIRRWCGLPPGEIDFSLLQVKYGPPQRMGRAGLAVLARSMPKQPSLVVVDTLGAAVGKTGADTNQEAPMSVWLEDNVRPMQDLWPEAVVWLVHHLPKDVKIADDPIGTHRSGSDVWIMFNVVPLAPPGRERHGGSYLRLTKDRDDETGLVKFERVVEFEMGDGQEPVLRMTVRRADPDGTVEADLPAKEWTAEDEQRLLDILAKREGRGGSVESLRSEHGGGRRSTVFSKMVADMASRGLVGKEPRKGIWLL